MKPRTNRNYNEYRSQTKKEQKPPQRGVGIIMLELYEGQSTTCILLKIILYWATFFSHTIQNIAIITKTKTANEYGLTV